mmetsp:Transcript_9928/g.33697  ORF Transcript_9928/g.33697 Transcript_9928/m.33697 type:complete len:137 (-) Transcript_9928:31-441(-)
MALFNGEPYAFEVSEAELVAAIEANVARREADDTCLACAPAPPARSGASSVSSEATDLADAFQTAAARLSLADRVSKAKARADIVKMMGPPLPIAAKHRDLDSLQEYRREYLRYRSGAAVGAHDRTVLSGALSVGS